MTNDDGRVLISVAYIDNNTIRCSVDNDGIEREISMRNKLSQSVTYESKGMKLVKNRLNLYNIIHNNGGSVEVIDKKDANGNASGTLVMITFKNKMMRAIIIDDEPRCITALKGDLDMFCPEVEVVESCHSGKEGLLAIKKCNPDLIFLEVEMPWMNGFEMLDVFGGEINFHIIFTTAYDRFALDAFRVSAIDYLLKPIDSKDLVNTIQKLKKILHPKENSDNISALLKEVKASSAQQKIAVPTRNGYSFIQANEIMYCKGSGAYTAIYLVNNKNIVLSKSIGETEQLLPSDLFERIHNSLLINIYYVNEFVKNDGTYLIMKNGEELNVSKSKKEHLLERLGIK